jgi:hypothetical protein
MNSLLYLSNQEIIVDRSHLLGENCLNIAQMGANVSNSVLTTPWGPLTSIDGFGPDVH